MERRAASCLGQPMGSWIISKGTITTSAIVLILRLGLVANDCTGGWVWRPSWRRWIVTTETSDRFIK